MYPEYRTSTATAATTTATIVMLECHIDKAGNAARDEAHAMANALLVMADSRHVSMPSVDGLSDSGKPIGAPGGLQRLSMSCQMSCQRMWTTR